MNEISDEILMAYADGELEGEMRARVESYLARSPNGKERLLAFTETGRNLADLFDQPMREPVPQRLLNAIASSDRQQIIVPSVKNPVRSEKRRLFWPRSQALAASLAALLVGVGSFWLFHRMPSGTGDLGTSTKKDEVADASLASALETVASGKTSVLTVDGQTASIRPVFSFATAASGYCRQYEIFRSNFPVFAGVACREANGAWRIETQVSVAARHPADGSIAPAGKEVPDEIEAVVSRLISGDVLSNEEEARVMGHGWRGDRQ